MTIPTTRSAAVFLALAAGDRIIPADNIAWVEKSAEKAGGSAVYLKTTGSGGPAQPIYVQESPAQIMVLFAAGAVMEKGAV